MPSKRRVSSDPMQSATSIFAITIATDEEYAAGLPFKDPRAVITGKAPRKRKKQTKKL